MAYNVKPTAAAQSVSFAASYLQHLKQTIINLQGFKYPHVYHKGPTGKYDNENMYMVYTGKMIKCVK